MTFENNQLDQAGKMSVRESEDSEIPSFNVVLINPYELGRQPFALAQPCAWLNKEGFQVDCLDLSLQKLEPLLLGNAGMIAIYIGMHTATRIAVEALPRIRNMAPDAHLCVYGLYAPMNAEYLRELGVQSIFGGECEPELLALARQLRTSGKIAVQTDTVVNLSKIDFIVPDRSRLPALKQYAHLNMPDSSTKVVGFAEGTRGCKHFCTHCPVVPVYKGKFRVIPVDIVMADIRQQMASGAQHISFGDPDFLNGPVHAMKIVRALHHEFPELTYDATIKIQHLINHADLLPELKQTGCLFIIAAVEAIDDEVLGYLEKNHTCADFIKAADLVKESGIALSPTFVPFTPWTTLGAYLALLRQLVNLELVESVAPIQLSIRLLIPQGSHMLNIPGFTALIKPFDPELLGYPWTNPDPRVDQLQKTIQTWIAEAEQQSLSRYVIFDRIWKMAHEVLGKTAPELSKDVLGPTIPHMSEPWYCCAEPTDQLLKGF